MRFRKKPVVIDAVQFTEELRAASLFDGAPLPPGVRYAGGSHHPGRREIYSASYYIKTLEGDMRVDVGDWVITGVKGAHYPCKPDIFAATYDAVSDSIVSDPVPPGDKSNG